MKPIQITCQTCGGCGKVPLEGALAEALDAIREIKGGTAVEVHAKLKLEGKVGVTSVHNRLEDLRMLGLLIRTRVGQRWIYRYTKLKP